MPDYKQLYEYGKDVHNALKLSVSNISKTKPIAI